MTYEEALEEQIIFDRRKVECRRCNKETLWGELREFGDCLECYYKYSGKHQEKNDL